MKRKNIITVWDMYNNTIVFRERRKASANVTGAGTHTRTSVYIGGRIATTANPKLISRLITFGQRTSDATTTATAAATESTNTEAADGRAATDDRRRAYSGGGVRRLRSFIIIIIRSPAEPDRRGRSRLVAFLRAGSRPAEGCKVGAVQTRSASARLTVVAAVFTPNE